MNSSYELLSVSHTVGLQRGFVSLGTLLIVVSGFPVAACKTLSGGELRRKRRERNETYTH